MKCSECRWWKNPPERWRAQGECRRLAPFPRNIIITTERGNRDDSEGAWPGTDAGDWCGQFEAKPPEPAPTPAFVTAAVPEATGGPG